MSEEQPSIPVAQPAPIDIHPILKAVDSLAEIVNIVDKVINKGGLWLLAGIATHINHLKSEGLVALKQLPKLAEVEREQVEQHLKSAVHLSNSSAQVKFVGAVDSLEKIIDLVEDGMDLFSKGKVLFDEIKALVGA